MSEEKISIEGLDKAAVLAALYDRAKPQGLGFLHYTPEPMTRERAESLVSDPDNLYFDYVQGRVMKVDLSGDSLDPRLYDRDNGQGAAARALIPLRDDDDARPVRAGAFSRSRNMTRRAYFGVLVLALGTMAAWAEPRDTQTTVTFKWDASRRGGSAEALPDVPAAVAAGFIVKAEVVEPDAMACRSYQDCKSSIKDSCRAMGMGYSEPTLVSVTINSMCPDGTGKGSCSGQCGNGGGSVEVLQVCGCKDEEVPVTRLLDQQIIDSPDPIGHHIDDDSGFLREPKSRRDEE